MSETFFAWPLRDGLRRGLERYIERYGTPPAGVYLRKPDALELAGVPVDVVWMGPVCPAPPPSPARVYQQAVLPELAER